MSTVAIGGGAYEQIGDYTDKVSFSGPKRMSSVQKFICLTTDEKSLGIGKDFLQIVTNLKENIAGNTEEITPADAIEHLKVINVSLARVSGMFAFIKDLFQAPDNEVEIDDKNMYEFLAIHEKAKNTLEAIAIYFQLIIDISKTKEEMVPDSEFYNMTIEALTAKLSAA